MLRLTGAALLVFTGSVFAGAAILRGAPPPDLSGTRLAGVQTGPHAVGFDVVAESTGRMRLALWYPARAAAPGSAAVTQLEYRQLEFENATPGDARAFVDQQVDVLVNARHVGIVPLTREQARDSLSTRGIAIRKAPALARRFPVVLVFGGQYYLSTTAEMLASHGFLVAAPFRASGPPLESPGDDFTVYVENDLRAADWAVARIRTLANADAARINVIGHGGGGQRAVVFAMRNPDVSAVVNVDAGNFSTRSDSSRIRAYDPAQVRAPYLYLATEATRTQQDRFDEFLRMERADRFEVILRHADLKHHDLSDLGRGVTEPLRLRGDSLQSVEEAFATSQEVIVRFLQTYVARTAGQPDDFERWLYTRLPTDRYRLTRHRTRAGF